MSRLPSGRAGAVGSTSLVGRQAGRGAVTACELKPQVQSSTNWNADWIVALRLQPYHFNFYNPTTIVAGACLVNGTSSPWKGTGQEPFQRLQPMVAPTKLVAAGAWCCCSWGRFVSNGRGRGGGGGWCATWRLAAGGGGGGARGACVCARAWRDGEARLVASPCGGALVGGPRTQEEGECGWWNLWWCVQHVWWGEWE